MVYKTEQENFWSGEFGAAYIERNKGERLINANIVKFSQVLRSAELDDIRVDPPWSSSDVISVSIFRR